MSAIKNIIFGEPMPDKNDPKYKERYEREVAAGRKFANASGISWASKHIQSWGQRHKAAFLVIVFGIMISGFIMNVLRMAQAYRHSGPRKAVAVERMDSALHERLQTTR